jgi:hypothetical protein
MLRNIKKDKVKKKQKKTKWIVISAFVILLSIGILLVMNENGVLLNGEELKSFLNARSEYGLGIDNINLTVQTNDAEWVVTKHSGEEMGLKFWTLNAKDKKTELGWIPLDNSCTGWADKFLYDSSGYAILDDKSKEIELKCESAKCDGFNCYHISLTDAAAVNIGEYVQLGNNTIITEYQNLSLVNYKSDWFGVNVTLFMNMSGNWNSSANDIWVRHDPDKEKFGAIVNNTEDTYFKYLVESDNEIKKGKGLIYYISRFKPTWCGSVRCTEEELHNFDFSDICSERRNMTVINETEGEIDETVLFNPQCSFNQIDDFNLEVEFYGEYNSTLGYIDVDPTITISDVSSAVSILTNITTENNFTHLTIGDDTIDFINDSNLVLYMPFDVNTSNDVYDYSANNNDGIFNGTSHWNNVGYIGGSAQFDAPDQADDLIIVPDSPSLNLNTLDFTVSFWSKSTDTAIDRVVGVIIRKRGTEGWQISQANGGGLTRFRVDEGAANVDADIGSEINNGEWQHVVAIRNGSGISIFLNGNHVNTTADATKSDLDHVNDLSVGGHPAGWSFNGTLDEVMIINNSLTDAEILSLHNNQSSRFFGTGTQEFVNNNITNGTFINITINSSTNVNSFINVSLGNLSGSTYDFGSEFAFTNNFVSDIPLGTPNNFSLKFTFYAGNSTDNAFISPTLENNILIDSFGEAAEAADSCACANATNDWTIDLADACYISLNCNLSTGTLNFTGTGNATCNATIYTSNLGDPQGGTLFIDDACRINVA